MNAQTQGIKNAQKVKRLLSIYAELIKDAQNTEFSAETRKIASTSAADLRDYLAPYIQ